MKKNNSKEYLNYKKLPSIEKIKVKWKNWEVMFITKASPR